MTHGRSTLTLLGALVAALVLATPAAVATPPRIIEDESHITLVNDHIQVRFAADRPALRVAPADAVFQANTDILGSILAKDLPGYAVTFDSIVEYRDLDANGIASAQEVVASLELGNATAWHVERIYAPDLVALNYTLHAPVTITRATTLAGQPGLALPEREAIVSLVFVLRETATEVDAAGVNVTLPATAFRYDLVVTQWPFVNADLDRLAMETVIGANVTRQEEAASGQDGARVLTGDDLIGHLAWSPSARGNNSQTDIDVPVKAAFAPAAGNATLVTFTYDAAGYSTLRHDGAAGLVSTPETLNAAGGSGTLEDARSVPGLSPLAGLGAAGAVAWLAVRRRR